MSNTTLSVDDIYAMVDASGKGPPKAASWGTFLSTALVGVPLFVGFVVPGVALTIATNAVLGLVIPSSTTDSNALAPIDSGIEAPSTVTELSKRTFDVIILGATGFTGKLAVEYMAREYHHGSSTKIKWAIAGRSQAKLDKVKKDVAKLIGDDENLLSEIPTILVDTSKPSMLPDLVKDSRCILTTVGPFERYGSGVVEACAKYGTHYVDTTGEVGWVNTMQLAWQETAQKTGAKIVSLCGNDSIPCDITTMQVEKFLADRGETLIKMETLYEWIQGLSGGTLATAKLGLSGKSRQDPKYVFDANYRLADGTESPAKTDLSQVSLIPRNTGWSGRYAKWTKSFTVMHNVNGRVVQRSHALRNHGNKNPQPLVYQECEAVQDFKSGFVNTVSFFLTFGLMAIPPTRALLSQILPKQGEGPSRKNMFETSYCALSGQGTGSKGTKVQSVLYFDKCVGYASTARMIVESALCLALSKSSTRTGSLTLPSGEEGGFFTPSTGLGSALVDRLVSSKTCYFALKEVKE